MMTSSIPTTTRQWSYVICCVVMTTMAIYSFISIDVNFRIPEFIALRLNLSKNVIENPTSTLDSQISIDNESSLLDLHHMDTKLALWGLPLNGTPPEYLKNYKNPCWYQNSRSASSGNRTFYCLPYFYQLGVGKSGTSTLYRNLITHPDICQGSQKEIFFWSEPNQRKNLMNYIRKFSKAANAIKRQVDSSGYHTCVTGEATPGYFTRQGNLAKIPDNWDYVKNEPKYTMAHTLFTLNPKTKLLVALRNPTDRLFSHYHHFHNKGFAADDFHDHVVIGLAAMKKCLAHRSERSCAFDFKLNEMIRQNRRIMLHFSIYYPYVVEWLSVFPRNQIKFVISEDWYQNSTRVMREILGFLELRKPSPSFYKDIDKNMTRYRKDPSHLFNDTSADMKRDYHNVMYPETRRILDDFFAPFNVKLAKLLGDDRFLFWNNA